MGDLHNEVIALTQALIRIDTTNGNETEAARLLADYLTDAGVDCEFVARDPARANLIAKIAGHDPDAESLAFVGHLDVVPADPRDWSHPPFAAEINDEGYLFGRGAVDMKNEVAARVVAMAELARADFRPRGDLWLIMVADEEDGIADVGMRWLLESRPDLRPDLAINEGGGSRYELANGRTVAELSIGDKGTQPARVVALGEAGHASMPTLGDNAVPHLGTLLTRVGQGAPRPVVSPLLQHTLAVLLGREVVNLDADVAEAAALHPLLTHVLPPLGGLTLAPTMLGGSAARNVMPARAWMDLDCRLLPGTTRAEVEAEVRYRLGDDVPFEIEWPDQLVPGSVSLPEGRLPSAIAEFLAAEDPDAILLPLLCTGYTDSSFLRIVGETAAYGFSPFLSTPATVIAAGYHNANERVHVDDLLLSVRFHIDLARRLLTSPDTQTSRPGVTGLPTPPSQDAAASGAVPPSPYS
jgi:acetylornithine deacetylase/succinyl-diaminopimelate desuccinylase-like protein